MRVILTGGGPKLLSRRRSRLDEAHGRVQPCRERYRRGPAARAHAADAWRWCPKPTAGAGATARRSAAAWAGRLPAISRSPAATRPSAPRPEDPPRADTPATLALRAAGHRGAAVAAFLDGRTARCRRGATAGARTGGGGSGRSISASMPRCSRSVWGLAGPGGSQAAARGAAADAIPLLETAVDELAAQPCDRARRR